MRKLGFTLARAKTVAALLAGPQYIIIEARETQGRKNLLASGEVTPEDVAALLRCCRGSHDQYRETPHHRAPEIPVHEFKPVRHGVRWYIKVYFSRERRHWSPRSSSASTEANRECP